MKKGDKRYKLAVKRNARRAAAKTKAGVASIKAAQAKRDEELKQQIIAAHETLSVHDDHELKHPMDYPPLAKKNCKKGKGKKAAPKAAPKGKKAVKKVAKKKF